MKSVNTTQCNYSCLSFSLLKVLVKTYGSRFSPINDVIIRLDNQCSSLPASNSTRLTIKRNLATFPACYRSHSRVLQLSFGTRQRQHKIGKDNFILSLKAFFNRCLLIHLYTNNVCQAIITQNVIASILYWSAN